MSLISSSLIHVWVRAVRLRALLTLGSVVFLLCSQSIQAQILPSSTGSESVLNYGGQTFEVPVAPVGYLEPDEWSRLQVEFGQLNPEKQQKFLEYRKSILLTTLESLAAADVFGRFKSEPTTSEWWQSQRILDESAVYFEKPISNLTRKPFQFILQKINSQIWRSLAVATQPSTPVSFITLTISAGLTFSKYGFYRYTGLGILSEPIEGTKKTRRTLFLLSDRLDRSSQALALDINLALRFFKGEKTLASSPEEAMRGTTLALPGPLMYYSGPTMRAKGLSVAMNAINTGAVLLSGVAPSWFGAATASKIALVTSGLEVLGKVSFVPTVGQPKVLRAWESSPSPLWEKIRAGFQSQATRVLDLVTTRQGLCTLSLNQ